MFVFSFFRWSYGIVLWEVFTIGNLGTIAHLYDLLLGTKISIVMVNAQSLNLFYR